MRRATATTGRDATGPGDEAAAAIHPVTLRFADGGLEAQFRAHLFRTVMPSVRAGHVLGIATWAAWGLMIRQYTAAAPELDLVVRFGVLVPLLLVGLASTFLPLARRTWEAEAVAVLLLNAVVWTLYVSAPAGVPFDLGYVGVILIMAFAYTLIRLRFVLVAGAGLAMVGLYFAAILAVGRATAGQLTLALYYLVSFYALGLIAAYTLERFTRLLFVREREVATERERSEALLLNVLPRAVVERLKGRPTPGTASGEAPILAEEHRDVAVVVADLAGFTEQAGRSTPDALVACLNDVFSDMDVVTDRHGLVKIKTAGDGYMAVAGVPEPVDDPAGRAVSMALELVEAVEGRHWPSGDPLRVRVGIAYGPVAAGVIGRRTFAYDVWGDAVNVASRLQTASRPGCVLVSEAVVELAGDRFEFGPQTRLELKGKGAQAARFVRGRAARIVRGRAEPPEVALATTR